MHRTDDGIHQRLLHERSAATAVSASTATTRRNAGQIIDGVCNPHLSR